MSQNDQILRHLKRYKRITPMQALGNYGCYRLAARILNLREAGYRIETEHRRLPNGKRHAVYHWREMT